MNLDITQLMERMPDARWFGGKGRALEGVEIVDSGVLDDGPPALALVIVRARFADGGEHLYHLPLLVEGDGSTREATDDVDRLRLLGDMMAHGTSIKGDHGIFQFGGPSLDPLAPPGSRSARYLGAEQSNTSLVLDEAVIIKLFRRVEHGRNPDLELTRLLTNEAFRHIPAHLGELIYQVEDSEEGDESQIDLAIAQRFIPEAREGWTTVLEQLRALYDAVDPADVGEDRRFLIEERAKGNLESIAALGEATASLHIALDTKDLGPELASEGVESFDLEEWAARARASLDTVLSWELDGVAELKDSILERVDALATVSDGGKKMRIHGDYHLGQVIRSSTGWMILDFEGEPARTLEERRAKSSPLRDAAGMLRSFNYAAMAILFERGDPSSDEWKRLEPWADEWETIARERFFQAYLTRSHEGSFLPPDREELSVMLDAFEIDKALYEVGYERSHRPDWIRIPLRGIARVLERGESR